MSDTRLRIALITVSIAFLSIGFANAACYLNVVEEDSSEYEGYLNVSLDVPTSSPYIAEMMITDENQAFFPDAAIETILVNIPADQIESVTDSEGNEWEINEASEEADGLGTFNTSIEPGEDAESTPAATVTIDLVDTWDESFPRNDEGYLIAVEIANIGEASDESAWVTIGFCEEETPVEEIPVDEAPADGNETETDNETVTDDNVTDDNETVIVDDNETTDNETIIIIDDNETIGDNETPAAVDCYLNVVQEEKSEYEGLLNATLTVDNETNNTAEIDLSNETLETFQNASISTILLNVPAEEIDNVTDAEGNELNITETEVSETNDMPFGQFLTRITSIISDQEENAFGSFITEITVPETANATGPITISFTDEWEGVLPPNNESYGIALEVQNIGEMEEDSAWITLGSCEVNDTAANDTMPANDSQDIFITLQNEHETVIGLLEEAIGTGSADTFMQIRDELSIHMTGEEEVVYPALQDIGLEEHAQLAEQEHAEARLLIAELEAMDEEDEMWIPTLVQLQEVVEQHVMHEEEDIFPLAQEQLSTEEAQQLEEEYLDSKDQVNTESINTIEVQIT